MPHRIADDIRPEFRNPQARAFLLANLEMLGARMKMIEKYRANGFPTMTMLDGVINFAIFTFAAIGGNGTRQQMLVDSIVAPRRTIRTCLVRLEKGGLITRDENGMYHPAQITVDLTNASFEANFRQMERLAEAFIAWRAAIADE